MSAKISVGNLPYSVTDSSLKSNFAEVAQAAISALHGVSVDGRTIVVNLAHPREDSRGAGGDGAHGYRSSTRSDVGYGNGGYGGGRY